MNKIYKAFAYGLLGLHLFYGCSGMQAKSNPSENQLTTNEKIKKIRNLFSKKREWQKANGKYALDRIFSDNKEYTIVIFTPDQFEAGDKKDLTEIIYITKFIKQNSSTFEQIQLSDHKLDGICDTAKTVKITLEETHFTTRQYEQKIKEYNVSTNTGVENKDFYEKTYSSILDEIITIYEN